MTNSINNKTKDLKVYGVTEVADSNSSFGFASAVRGAVTQLTSKSTAVTINKLSGVITTHNETTLANTGYNFTVNNNKVAAGDIVILGVQDHGGVVNYTVTPFKISDGYFKISLFAYGGASNNIDINFAIIKNS